MFFNKCSTHIRGRQIARTCALLRWLETVATSLKMQVGKARLQSSNLQKSTTVTNTISINDREKDRKNVTGAFFLLEEGYTTVNHDSLHNEFRLERHERAGSFDFVTHSRSS